MVTPEEPQQADTVVQVGLADTPQGQRVAVVLTVLLGKDAALGVADAIRQTADQMSASGLIVAAPGVPANGKAAANG